MSFKDKLAFFQNAIQQNSNNSSLSPQNGGKQSYQSKKVQQPRNTQPSPKIITPQKPVEPKIVDPNLKNDFSSALEVFKNRVEKQIDQTKSPLKKEAQNTTRSSKGGFAAKLAFYQKNQQIQDNKSTTLQEPPKNSHKSSNLHEKINKFNALKVPLGQPTDYTKKRNSNYQTDENNQPQLVFPTELLTKEKNIENEENQEMPFRRPVRFSTGRRRPTNLPDN